MNTQESNYYQILNIPENASPEEIDEAYDLVWQSYEMDELENYSSSSHMNGDAIMQRISCAYMTLIDPTTRIRYDQSLHSQPSRPLVENDAGKAGQPSPSQNSSFSIFHRAFNGTPRQNPLVLPQEPPHLFFEQSPANLTEDARVSEKTLSYSMQEELTKPPISQSKAFAELMEDHLATRCKVRKIIEKKNKESRQKIENFISTIKTFNGQLLQQIRQLKSIKLVEVAQETCVKITYLQAIESEEFSKLPNGLIYVKNYIRAYARCLELPVQKITEDCLELYDVWQQHT